MEYKFLSPLEEEKKSKDELINYYKKMRTYYQKEKPRNTILPHKPGHKIALPLMKTTKNFEIEYMNKNKLDTNASNIIYAVNHSNCHDIPTVCEIIKKQAFILLGVQDLRIIDSLVFSMNGRIDVDRKDKMSKALAKEEMLKLLLHNQRIIVFPEATWNTTENLLHLPINWGILDIAKIAGAIIKPINLEYINDKCIANIGDDILVSFTDSKTKKIVELEDAFSTLKWDCLDEFAHSLRSEITQKDYDIYSKDRYEEYKKLDVEYEQSIIRKKYITEEEAFRFLLDLELNKDNAFLASVKKEYVLKYKAC